MSPWLLIDDARHDSRSNMARDTALLESVISGALPGVLRIYDWSDPAVTLGFHQRSFTPHDPSLRLPLLRRPTGGGAVLHVHDLTFSLSTLEAGIFSRGIEETCRAVTSLFARALQGCGIDARVRGERGAFSSVCFKRSSPVELCIGDAKILGLAGLRRKGAVLLQGVMPLSVDADLSRRVFGGRDDPLNRGLLDRAPGFSCVAFLERLADAFASETDILFSQGGEHDGEKHHDDQGKVHLR